MRLGPYKFRAGVGMGVLVFKYVFFYVQGYLHGPNSVGQHEEVVYLMGQPVLGHHGRDS